MRISYVVAATTNNVIGKNNQLLWHLPDDLKFFKKVTMGFPVVMGRNTFDSVGKPLPGRRNIVISRNQNLEIPGCEVVHSVEEVLSLLKAEEEVMVIGGAEIYRLFFPLVNRIYMTRIDTVLEGDAFFPEIDAHIWKLTKTEPHSTDERHKYAFSFEIWDKIA